MGIEGIIANRHDFGFANVALSNESGPRCFTLLYRQKDIRAFAVAVPVLFIRLQSVFIPGSEACGIYPAIAMSFSLASLYAALGYLALLINQNNMRISEQELAISNATE